MSDIGSENADLVALLGSFGTEGKTAKQEKCIMQDKILPSRDKSLSTRETLPFLKESESLKNSCDVENGHESDSSCLTSSDEEAEMEALELRLLKRKKVWITKEFDDDEITDFIRKYTNSPRKSMTPTKLKRERKNLKNGMKNLVKITSKIKESLTPTSISRKSLHNSQNKIESNGDELSAYTSVQSSLPLTSRNQYISDRDVTERPIRYQSDYKKVHAANDSDYQSSLSGSEYKSLPLSSVSSFHASEINSYNSLPLSPSISTDKYNNFASFSKKVSNKNIQGNNLSTSLKRYFYDSATTETSSSSVDSFEESLSKTSRRSSARILCKRFLTVFWIPLFILISTVAYISVLKLQNHNMINSKSFGETNETEIEPILSPTAETHLVPKNSRAEMILQKLSNVTGKHVLFDDRTTQYRAALWIISGDARNITAHDPYLIQRYSLASLYFSTTISHDKKFHRWKHCGASSIKQNQTCYVTADGVLKYNFLSSASECEWYGVSCDSYGYVSKLNIGKLEILLSIIIIESNLGINLSPITFPANNELRGTIPLDLYFLSNLTSLGLSRNELIGTISSNIENFQKLQSLDLCHNRLVGVLPMELSHLQKIRNLNLGHNAIKGVIPPSIFVPSLVNIDLGPNELTGHIPEELFRVPNLKSIDLSFNNLEGTLSVSLGNSLKNLEQMRLESNLLTGTIPEFWARKDLLEEFNVGFNKLNGTLPNSILRSLNMKLLNVGVNLLSGTISSSFRQMQNLNQLILWSNNFTGTIPSELSQLRKLEILHLSMNYLTGDVPEELCWNRDQALRDLSSDCKLPGSVNCECCSHCSIGH